MWKLSGRLCHGSECENVWAESRAAFVCVRPAAHSSSVEKKKKKKISVSFVFLIPATNGCTADLKSSRPGRGAADPGLLTAEECFLFHLDAGSIAGLFRLQLSFLTVLLQEFVNRLPFINLQFLFFCAQIYKFQTFFSFMLFTSFVSVCRTETNIIYLQHFVQTS